MERNVNKLNEQAPSLNICTWFDFWITVFTFKSLGARGKEKVGEAPAPAIRWGAVRRLKSWQIFPRFLPHLSSQEPWILSLAQHHTKHSVHTGEAEASNLLDASNQTVPRGYAQPRDSRPGSQELTAPAVGRSDQLRHCPLGPQRDMEIHLEPPPPVF